MKLAVIDIGSNSVRLMLWADGKTLYKRLKTTRLGEGIALSPRLKTEAIDRSVRAVSDFYGEAKESGVDGIFAFATAAVRRAENGGEFCRLVKNACGIQVDVVSGKEEALLGLKGALGNADGGIIDIGGASTEVCFQKDGEKTFAVSLDVGAVRLFDLCKDERNALTMEIGNRTASLGGVQPFGKICAVGGTATTLAAVKLGLTEYDAACVQDCVLTLKEVSTLADRLLSTTVEERRNIAGISARRAEIVAGGTLLLAEIMKKLKLCELFVSDRDNLEGYLSVRGLV